MRTPGERAVPVDSAPGGDDREYANRGGGFPAAEAKCGPHQKRKAEIFEGVIFRNVAKSVAEDEPGSGEKSQK